MRGVFSTIVALNVFFFMIVAAPTQSFAGFGALAVSKGPNRQANVSYSLNKKSLAAAKKKVLALCQNKRRRGYGKCKILKLLKPGECYQYALTVGGVRKNFRRCAKITAVDVLQKKRKNFSKRAVRRAVVRKRR